MSKKNEIPGLVTGLVAILAAVCFFLLGFLTGSWHYAWLVFLTVPVAAIVMDIVTKNKDIQGSVIGLIAIIAAITYFVLGFVFGKWHPGWLVFLAIPIAAILLVIYRKKDAGAVVGLVALLATVAFMLLGTFLGIWYIAWLVFLLIPITAIIINIVKAAQGEQKAEGGKTEDMK
jgi:hypothetical protein